MDLSRIVLHSVRADKAKEFIRALEELPDETIKGDSHPDKISAYPDAYDEENGIDLNVRYTPLEEPESIIFSVPANSTSTPIEDGI